MPTFPLIRIVPSKSSEIVGDCGICALGTLLHKTYEDIVVIADQFYGASWKNGLWATQIIAIAEQFGVELIKRRKYDLDVDTGILICKVIERYPNTKPKAQDHAVLLHDGKIFDWDMTVWDPDAFKSHYSAKFGTLLRLESN